MDAEHLKYTSDVLLKHEFSVNFILCLRLYICTVGKLVTSYVLFISNILLQLPLAEVHPTVVLVIYKLWNFLQVFPCQNSDNHFIKKIGTVIKAVELLNVFKFAFDIEKKIQILSFLYFLYTGDTIILESNNIVEYQKVLSVCHITVYNCVFKA